MLPALSTAALTCLLLFGVLIRRAGARPFTFYAIGDSITVGFNASSQATTAWLPVLETDRGWDFTNLAHGGDTVTMQADEVYSIPVTRDTVTTHFLGANDEIFHSTADMRADWQTIQLIELAWLAIPDSQKVLGTDTGAVSYSGTWTDTAQFGLGKKTTVQNATATFTVTGTAIVLGFIANSISEVQQGRFSITVDGQLQGNYSSSFLGLTAGLVYAPFGVLIEGLSGGPHTVVVEKTSFGGFVWFDWAAGLTGLGGANQPYVYVANVLYQSTSGYIGNGGSVTNTNAFNAMIAANVARLHGLGLKVKLVDVNAALNTSTDLDSDGIHPNDSGHAKLAAAFSAAMNPVERLMAVLSAPGGLLRRT